MAIKGSWEWNSQRSLAAELLAAGSLTNAEIVARVGVGKRQYYYWLTVPEFKARVEELATAQRAALAERSISNRQARLDALDDLWQRMRQLIRERAADPAMAKVPGGRTGLLVRELKLVKVLQSRQRGKDGSEGELMPARAVIETEVYTFDSALIREIRETQKMAAQELGQWSEKVETTGAGGGPVELRALIAQLTDLSDEELNTVERALGSVEHP